MSHAEKPDLLDTPVESLELSTRLYNCLTTHNGMKTLREVVALSEREMLRTPNLGRVALRELVDVLADYGLALQPEYMPPVMATAVAPLKPPTVHQRLAEIEARLDAIEQREVEVELKRVAREPR